MHTTRLRDMIINGAGIDCTEPQFDPNETAAMWNNDHQRHVELWPPY
jgi:hypothetical protein